MPESFGRYELLDLLGRGGMGEVYRAYDSVRERTVALKLLPRHLADDATFPARFQRECRLAAKLNEPHIVPIHDFGEIDGRLFLDMRLVEGRDLAKLLTERGPLPPATVVDIVTQVAAALDAAHDSGLVHRDVKPSNILVTGRDLEQPFVYLVDFGIARAAGDEASGGITGTTATVGTVAYMAPERIAGEVGDRRGDVYALACVLYEMLTRHRPFEGEMFSVMYQHRNAPAPTPSETVPSVPRGLDAVVAHGMAKQPQDRFPTAGDLARAARAALAADPPAGPKTFIGERGVGAPPTPLPPSPFAGMPPTGGPPHPHGPPGGPSNAAAPPGPPTGPPGHWTPVTTHGSGPVPQGRGNQRRGNRRRIAIIAGSIAAVVAAAAVLIGVLAANRGSGSSTPGGDSSPAGKSTPVQSHTPVAAGQPTTLPTGPATSTPTWAHFAAFTKLLGRKDNDAAAFLAGRCALQGPAARDAPGVVDEVDCDINQGSVKVGVDRFDTAADAQAFVRKALQNYTGGLYAEAGKVRGVAVTIDSTDTRVVSTICGLPNYLVEFSAASSSAVPLVTLQDQYWAKATFPDATPAACDKGFTGPATGATAVTGTAPKSVPAMTAAQASALLIGDADGLTTTAVAESTGFQLMLLTQTGTVSFWQYQSAGHTLASVGSSSYPYSPSTLGRAAAAGRGQRLSGMGSATFIVNGNFSTDHTGNAVAYTNAGKGWGAIKAQPNGNLQPVVGAGVGIKAIGLSQGFDFSSGLLVTADCSRALPIAQCYGNNRVLKYWRWNQAKGQFVVDHTGGRPR